MLIVIDVEPQRMFATDVDGIYNQPDLYFLGLAHRGCVDLARARLEAQQVALPADLPKLLVDDETGVPALHSPPAAGACAYCGAADATNEHVFPKWVSRELTKLAPLKVNTAHGLRPLRSLEITAPVCEKCNTRWLSVLENDVQPILRPLIHGQERMLDRGEQRLLAAWAAKTAFMLDLAGGAPVIPTGFYYEFRQLRTALPSQVVWLGAYSGKKAIWAGPLQLGIGSESAPNGFVATFTASPIRCSSPTSKLALPSPPSSDMKSRETVVLRSPAALRRQEIRCRTRSRSHLIFRRGRRTRRPEHRIRSPPNCSGSITGVCGRSSCVARMTPTSRTT